jgi:MoaA/NifB/PqqE/SkfB family radical SAM enzyme
MSLMQAMSARALELGLPIKAQLDLTYRCNERCVHCYLDHEDHGEMSTAEIRGVLGQLADAGTFFLTISGGEIFMRPDLFEILEHARDLRFSIKLKTNAVMVRAAKAARLAALGIESVDVSLYSHVAETHDAITKLPHSCRRWPRSWACATRRTRPSPR